MIHETNPRYNLFSLHAQPEGVVACMPYERETKPGDAFRIEASEDLPEFRGSVMCLEHDLSLDGRFTWVAVWPEHPAMVEPYVGREWQSDILDAPKLSER